MILNRVLDCPICRYRKILVDGWIKKVKPWKIIDQEKDI